MLNDQILTMIWKLHLLSVRTSLYNSDLIFIWVLGELFATSDKETKQIILSTLACLLGGEPIPNVPSVYLLIIWFSACAGLNITRGTLAYQWKCEIYYVNESSSEFLFLIM